MRNCVSSLKIFGDFKMHKVVALEFPALYDVAPECVFQNPTHLCCCISAQDNLASQHLSQSPGKSKWHCKALDKTDVPKTHPVPRKVCIFISRMTLVHGQCLSYKQNCKMLYSGKLNQQWMGRNLFPSSVPQSSQLVVFIVFISTLVVFESCWGRKKI